MDEEAGQMEQWRANATADINQLNIKVGVILKRLRWLVPPTPLRVTISKPIEEGTH